MFKMELNLHRKNVALNVNQKTLWFMNRAVYLVKAVIIVNVDDANYFALIRDEEFNTSQLSREH